MKNSLNFFWNIISDTFTYLFKNIKTFFKITSVFIVLWTVGIFFVVPLFCNAPDKVCTFGNAGMLTAGVLFFVMSAIVAVNIIRHFFRKQEYKWFHLSISRTTLKFMAYNIALAALVILPTAIIIILTNYLMISSAATDMNFLLKIAPSIMLIGGFILCSRLYLVYGASALGEKMTLAKSFELTKGYTFSIWGAQILLYIPVMVIMYLFMLIPNWMMTHLSNEWASVVYFLYVVIGITISLFETALKASYYAHLYQYFCKKKKK